MDDDAEFDEKCDRAVVAIYQRGWRDGHARGVKVNERSFWSEVGLGVGVLVVVALAFWAGIIVGGEICAG